jgi:hypothetical protein
MRVFGELLEHDTPPAGGNWALAVAAGMDIQWLDDREASAHRRAFFELHLREQWERSQHSDADGWWTSWSDARLDALRYPLDQNQLTFRWSGRDHAEG